MANSKPHNLVYPRRLPKNYCIICGEPLGNFTPSNRSAEMELNALKIAGWICRDGCNIFDDDDYDESID